MDFREFDNRTKADVGAPFPLLNPNTLEPLMLDGQPCIIMIRGTTSPVFQRLSREMRLREAENESSPDEFDLESTHRRMVLSALPFIAGFKNVMLDGEPIPESKYEEFLNLTFPLFGKVEEVTTDENGQETKNFVFKMVNKPFAVQVQEYSDKSDKALGNA